MIVSIPFKRDLQNLQERGAPPLPAWFEQMGKELGFTYVDLSGDPCGESHGLERLLSFLRPPLDGQGERHRGESAGARDRRGDREGASRLEGDGGLVSSGRTLARMSRNSGADWVE